jgi:hypothetical protein
MDLKIRTLAMTAIAALALTSVSRAAEPAGAQGAARYAGWYTGAGIVVQLEARDGALIAHSAGLPDTRYDPEGEGKFFAAGADTHLVFQTGPDGEVASALVNRAGQPPVTSRRISAAEADRIVKAALEAQRAAAGPFDKAAKQATVAQIGAMLTDRYIFPDRAAQAKAKIDAALAAGDYDPIDDPRVFAQRLTEDLQSVTHDKHMRVTPTGGPAPAAAAPPQAPPPTNGGFARVDILKGNIGYIRLLNFPPPRAFNPAADQAMRDVAGTDALIIDMRDNGGGSAESDSYFGSFFFDPAKPVSLNSIVNRTPSTNTFTTIEFHTKPVASPYVNKPVYILTSSHTFSGGEAFVYDLQVQKRVSIYGETTGGGANPGGVFPVGGRFGIFVPMGRAENPATKTNWEGVGVVPDHPMDAKLAFQAAMSDAVTQLLKKKAKDAALISVKADLAKQTEPAPFVQAALLKFRTTPSPGAEAALRRQIEGLQKSQPDYAELSDGLANVTRQQLPTLEQTMARLGALKSVTFIGVGPAGGDLYAVAFEHGQTEWQIAPLTPDGKIDGLGFRETAAAAAR